MGKSAGKWIKAVLFGKKYSKSNFSKNVTPDKKTDVKTPAEDLPRNSPVISDPYQLTERGVETLELEKGSSGSSCDAIALSPVNQDIDSQSNNVLVPVNDAEMRRQEQAATKAQAVFRGYLARRAFRALKGIIRLQALIRGHLVRRQAVATLRCMRAIVKFQALARGRKVRLSDNWAQVCRKYKLGEFQDAKPVDIGANSFLASEKIANNTFVRQLLVKLPTTMPLSLQYDMAEPNSAWCWLERWSVSRFWDPPARTKKITKPKPQRKQGGPQYVEPEAGKSRRTVRKVPTPTNGENGALASSEANKPIKSNPRKLTSTQTELAQEQQAQSELERVKRNLRKVSSSTVQVPEKLETENEKPLPPLESVEIAKISAPADALDLETAISPEKINNSGIVDNKQDFLETPKNEPVDVPHDTHPAVETPSLENGVTLDDESCVKEEKSGKENQKTRKRRSLPAKQEYNTEKISQNSPSLPSYMAATESAKAKLRAQGSPKFSEDAPEYGNNARRHSLPASTNAKLSSLSPRIQKANGKVGGKTNASLTASRDDKAPGWRR